MKTSVLLVDDDLSVRESIKRVLEGAGYEVLLAIDGEEAVDIFTSHVVDLLILDLNVPLRTGWDVYEELTRIDPFISVVVITGLANQFHIAKGAGVGALLEKPVDPVILLKTLSDLLKEPNELRLRRLCGYAKNTRFAPSAGTSSTTPAKRAPIPLPGNTSVSRRSTQGKSNR